MTDLFWFLLPIGLVVVCVCVAALFDWNGSCYHKWGKWQWAETYSAYRQHRVCRTCGYTEVQQFKKIDATK